MECEFRNSADFDELKRDNDKKDFSQDERELEQLEEEQRQFSRKLEERREAVLMRIKKKRGFVCLVSLRYDNFSKT
jgi:flagellar motility protein MotE (MotC chaperone)